MAGPTGGFIIGYIPAAFLIGLINQRINKENKTLLYPVSMLGMIIYASSRMAYYHDWHAEKGGH